MRENKVRKPTAQELTQLKEYYKDTSQDEETANKIIDNSWFAVFDSDISNRPAYAGTLMVAVYGMPEFYEVFHFEKNKIKRIVLHYLNLEQSMQLTFIIHIAITTYMRTLGYNRKIGYNRRRQKII
jgi:hypothetical protein